MTWSTAQNKTGESQRLLHLARELGGQEEASGESHKNNCKRASLDTPTSLYPLEDQTIILILYLNRKTFLCQNVQMLSSTFQAMLSLSTTSDEYTEEKPRKNGMKCTI
jgi:hypothetical protein